MQPFSYGAEHLEEWDRFTDFLPVQCNAGRMPAMQQTLMYCSRFN